MMQAKASLNKGAGCLYWFILFIGIAAVFSFSPQQKRYRVDATLQEWNEVIISMQQSNAPSITTNRLINIITSQIEPVLQSEQKALQDSLNKAKPKN